MAQLVLAPVTLVIAGSLVLAARIGRRRPGWLLLPALGSACWLAMAGLPAAARALVTGSGRLIAAELAVAAHPVRLLHPATAFAGTGRELPQELPLLVLAGAVEAAIASWLGSGAAWDAVPGRRSGVVAAVRRRASAAALAAGHTVTASGCAIGLDCHSGRLAAVSWAEAESGVLLTGGDLTELDQIGLAMACAAVRRRKAVLVLEGAVPRARLDPWRASVCAQVAVLAGRVSVPVACIGSVDCAPAPGAAPVPGARTSGAVSLNRAFGRAIRERSVVLVPAHQPDAAQPAGAQSEAARQAVSDLVGTLMSLRELGLRGDSLVWVSGCEAAHASDLSDLLALGQATGTAVVLSTTSAALAADLVAEAGLVVASGPITGNLAQQLADLAVGNGAVAPPMGHGLPIEAQRGASIGNRRPSALELMPETLTAKRAVGDILQGQRRGSATMIADGAILRHRNFRIVPIDVREVR